MTTQVTGLQIRPFSDQDYERLAELRNAVYTEFSDTADELRFSDAKRPEKCRHQRWAAELDGQVMGFAEYDQSPHVYDPRKFSSDVVVDLDRLQQGIGRRLYATIIDALRSLDPVSIDVWTRDDMACRVRFFEDRGLVESWRMWASELDLTTFDPTPFAHYREDVAAQGVVIKSLEELADDPERERKVFELWNAVRVDVPIPPGEVRQDTPFDEWLEQGKRPSMLWDGYFIAIEDGEYVGTSALFRSPEPDLLKTGLTAVRRSHRRRGIAVALKLRALEYAVSHGYRRVITDNASLNRPMLSINEQLGFVKYPAWVRYVGQWSVVDGQ
jgi:mycothiol synthase